MVTIRSASPTDAEDTPAGAATVDQARAFCAVANTGSYGEAAQLLGTNRIAVNRLVGRFTRALGRGPLVTASTSGRAKLTAQGYEVLAAAQRLIAAADELANTRTVVRLSAYPSITTQIIAACPDLLDARMLVELFDVAEQARRSSGSGLVADVVNGALDLAVAPAGLSGREIVEHELYRWTLRAMLPAARRGVIDTIRPAELIGFEIAAAPPGHRSRKLLESAFEADGLRLEVGLESSSQELLGEVAARSNRHAVVVPDDAFGACNDSLGPAIISGDSRAYGGAYSLYMRRVDVAKTQTQRSERISAVADRVRSAFGQRADIRSIS